MRICDDYDDGDDRRSVGERRSTKQKKSSNSLKKQKTKTMMKGKSSQFAMYRIYRKATVIAELDRLIF